MLKNVPVGREAREQMLCQREARKLHLLGLVEATHADAADGLRGPSVQERLPMQNAQERRTAECLARLKASAHILDGTALLQDPSVQSATWSDQAALKRLYAESGLAGDNPGVMASCERCCAYAEAISEALSRTACPAVTRLPSQSLGAVGMMRNVSSFAGDRGYHRKQLVARRMWEEMGVHPAYLEALRPAGVDSGPVRKAQYLGMHSSEIEAAMKTRSGQIWKAFSEYPDAFWLELAGFLSSRADEEGIPLTFDVILDHARKTRSTREGYESHVDQQSLFLSSRYATDTLNPEFEQVWLDLYRHGRAMLESHGVHLEQLRQDVAAHMRGE